jgi:hypothetical protein
MHGNWLQDYGFWFGLGGVLLSILSIAAAVFLYRKSIRVSKPYYGVKGLQLIGSVPKSVEGVTVSFRGTAVPKLTLSLVAVWNAGRLPIRMTDFAPLGQPAIEAAPEARILEATVVGEPAEENRISAKLDDDGRRVALAFDYLGPMEGFVVRCLHTGAKPEAVRVKGTVIDSGSVVEWLPELRRRGYSLVPLYWFLAWLLPVLAVWALIARAIPEAWSARTYVLVIGLLGSMVIGSLVQSSALERREPYRAVRGLDLFK